MQVLQRLKANTLSVKRPSYLITATKVDVMQDTTLLYTAAPSGDTTSSAILSAIAAGAYQISSAAGLLLGKKYVITEANKPTSEIEIIAITGTTLYELKFPVNVAYTTSALVKGITATASYTPAATVQKVVSVLWTMSDGSIYANECPVVNYLIQNPASIDDLLMRFPRIQGKEPEWQIRAALGWQPQLDSALDRVGTDLYGSAIILDRVRNISALKETVIAQAGLIILDSGIDPFGGKNDGDSRTQLLDRAQKELSKVISGGMVIDTSEVSTPAVVKQQHTEFSWERTNRRDWRV